MKRISIALGVLCIVLTVTVGWFMHSSIVKANIVKDLDSANLALAYGLLSDGLDSKRIDVYAAANAPCASYSVSGYEVRVVPLTLTTNRSTWGLANFLAHNHQAVLMHACHVWDSDRDLAVAELKLLSQVRPDARAVLEDYRKHGKLTATRGNIIQLHESQWKWFMVRFRQQPGKSSNQRIDGDSE